MPKNENKSVLAQLFFTNGKGMYNLFKITICAEIFHPYFSG